MMSTLMTSANILKSSTSLLSVWQICYLLMLSLSTFGPIALFQAFLPLLKASRNPKFVVVSSGVASSVFPSMGYGIHHAPYTLSKVRVYFILPQSRA